VVRVSLTEQASGFELPPGYEQGVITKTAKSAAAIAGAALTAISAAILSR
jgi:hypothetical protein